MEGNGTPRADRDRAGWDSPVTDDNKRSAVASELARADESLRAAELLVGAGLLHDAESRLYYAVYHAAVALLLTEDLQPRSHAGVASLFG